MKNLLITLLLISMAGNLLAQTLANGVNDYRPPSQNMLAYKNLPAVLEDVDIQKMFIDQEWMPGVVKFKSNRPDMQVPLIFDIYSNMLYYRQGSVIMEFVDSVSQFSIKIPYKNDSSIFTFASSYPAIQSNSPATFYQVVVPGKIQLLKCRAKSIYLFKEPSLVEGRKKEPKALYFAYLPGEEMVLLRNDEDELIKRMPAYATSIQKIIKEHHIKLKNEEKLAELFTYLNNE